MIPKLSTLTGALSLLVLIATALAQTDDQPVRRSRRVNRNFSADDAVEMSRAERGRDFAFARLVYSGGYGWRYGAWTTDEPKAEVNFIAGIKRLKNINVRERELYLPLTSKEIFKYPFLYAVEVGYMQLSQ